MQRQQFKNWQKARPISLVLSALWFMLGLATVALALGRSAEVRINWQTETELDTVGFNIYRSADVEGPYEQINDQLVPSVTGSASGADYHYRDKNVDWGRSYYYRIQDVQFDGAVQLHEPIKAQVESRAWWLVAIGVIALAAGLGLAFHMLRS